jgi:hypothetical protein
LPCRKKTIDDSSRLHVGEIARVMSYFLPFSFCNKKRPAIRHMKTPLSNDTIDSALRHREVSRAKDLSAPPPILCGISCRYIKFTETLSLLYTAKLSLIMGGCHVCDPVAAPQPS